jgi:hypothetical protein
MMNNRLFAAVRRLFGAPAPRRRTAVSGTRRIVRLFSPYEQLPRYYARPPEPAICPPVFDREAACGPGTRDTREPSSALRS